MDQTKARWAVKICYYWVPIRENYQKNFNMVDMLWVFQFQRFKRGSQTKSPELSDEGSDPSRAAGD